MSYIDQIDTLMASGPQTTEIDPATKKLIDAQRKRLETDSTDTLLQGVGNAGQGLMSQQPAYDFNAALGGDSATQGKQVIDAIGSRNNARSNDYISRLKNELRMTAPARDAEKLRMSGQILGKQTETDLQNNKIKKQYELDKKRVAQYKQQQKDAVLASILGTIGTIVGTGAGALIGGGAGASIGAKAGGTAGNMAGDAVNSSNIA